jgi:hypothetical protein
MSLLDTARDAGLRSNGIFVAGEEYQLAGRALALLIALEPES